MAVPRESRVALIVLVEADPPPRAERGQGWRQNALCRGLGDLFFPVYEDDGITLDRWRTAQNRRIAKALCQACPVLEPCQQWSIPNLSDGIAGAMTARQRNAIRKQLRLAEPATLPFDDGG